MKNFLSDADYAFVYGLVPRFCVSVLLSSPAGVALVKRNIKPEKGLWHLPGGRLFKGEKIADCVRRVLQRELGIAKFGVTNEVMGIIEAPQSSYAKGLMIHNIDIVVSAQTAVTVFNPSSDEGRPRWWTRCPSRNSLNTTQRQFLEKML